jgi:hypothetical protein
MKLKNFSFLIVLGIIMLQSCATILDGARNKTHVKNGNPPNAKVYYNGSYIGIAPVAVKVDKQCKKNQCYIEIKKEGYEPQKIYLTRKVSVGFTVLDVITGVFPLVIDFATGNIYKPRPNKIKYNLALKNGYNPLKKYHLKVGQKVLFSYKKYKNVNGEIVAVYPDRALIKFKRKANLYEKFIKKLKEVEDQIEVPYSNIAKK